MSDLVDRLRELVGYHVGDIPVLIHEAADRIAALEAGIIEALRNPDEDMRPILRKALHGDNQP